MDQKTLNKAIDEYKSACNYLESQITAANDAHMCLEQAFAEKYGEETLLELCDEIWENTNEQAILNAQENGERGYEYTQMMQSRAQREMKSFGYTKTEMVHIPKEDALAYFEKEYPVYLLYSDNTEILAKIKSDITNHNGLFGITEKDYEKSGDQLMKAIFGDLYYDLPGDEGR